MKERLNYRLPLSFRIMVLGLMMAAAAGCHHLTPRDPEIIPSGAKLDFQLMTEAWDTIEKVYVDRAAVKPKQMTYGAISGMVDSLGDTGHSQFLTPEMVKQEHHLTRGELEGIGAELRMRNNQVVIVAPLDDSPAQRAGLKPGDIILKVDGQDIDGLPLEQVFTRILGPQGTLVKLTVLNPKTGVAKEIDLIRARVTIHTVTWHRLPGTAAGHLRIAMFSKGVNRDLRKSLIDMGKEEVTGLILDLRNNPGGLLDEAVLERPASS